MKILLMSVFILIVSAVLFLPEYLMRKKPEDLVNVEFKVIDETCFKVQKCNEESSITYTRVAISTFKNGIVWGEMKVFYKTEWIATLLIPSFDENTPLSFTLPVDERKKDFNTSDLSVDWNKVFVK